MFCLNHSPSALHRWSSQIQLSFLTADLFCFETELECLTSTSLPMVERVQCTVNRCSYCPELILVQIQSAGRLQFLISQHGGTGGMFRQCLKLLERETAPVFRVLPGADNIETGCLCWGMNKTFHCELLSVCGRSMFCPFQRG